jgi:magnesium-transporting ATPase (P-type)
MGMEEVRNKKMSLTKDKILTSIPFDSSTKRATTVIEREDGTVRVYTKGAPDVLYGNGMINRVALPGVGAANWFDNASTDLRP